jgi:ribosomal protein L32E
MEVCHIQTIEVTVRTASEDKEKWVKERVHRLQHLFEQWQKPLGIDDREYRKYLTEELTNCCDDPLLKSFMESID